MKEAIIAGELGTGISEDIHLKPKPMIEIGGKPILWHIFKRYSSYGVNEFIIDKYFEDKLLITVASDGYLKGIK